MISPAKIILWVKNLRNGNGHSFLLVFCGVLFLPLCFNGFPGIASNARLLLALATASPPNTLALASQASGADPGRSPNHPQARSAGSAGEIQPPLPDVSLVLISLVILLMAAKLGGDLFDRIRQPAVLGELLLGVILGNLGLLGIYGLDYMKSDAAIHILAEVGVVLLLFEVGLSSNIREMLEVGPSSLLVASIGVITPLLLGWGVSAYFLPQADPQVHLFIGATLTATSVGLTARVLQDLGKTSSKEARIILGAAVIDDVMGLVLLAVVSGIISGDNHSGSGGLSLAGIGWISIKAVSFLVLAIGLGQKLSPRMFQWAALLRVHGMLLVTSIVFCFLLSFLASRIGLAPIVGAFAAGLILDPVHYEDFKSLGPQNIEQLISPLTTFLVPVFFVLMGLRVDLRSFADTTVLLFSVFLLLAAILGKQACALGVLERGLDRLSVGVGMIPRGEVGLIFAGVGSRLILKGEPVVNASTYAAVIIMVIGTTLVTPPILKLTMSRKRHGP